jgi:hypothetical protein
MVGVVVPGPDLIPGRSFRMEKINDTTCSCPEDLYVRTWEAFSTRAGKREGLLEFL